jgi:pimeloyl-ACP methyl ester carboxylesterase
MKARRLTVLICSLLCIAAQAQDIDTTKYYSSFDGTRIHYEVAGKGTPVLLVHGFVVNSQSWKGTALYSDLIKEGFEVIIVDLRGNGKSDKPHTPEAYLNDAEAKDLMGLITSLGIKHYAVAGYSRGAIITSRLLVLDNRVSKAVIGGMGTAFMNPEWPRRKMFYRGLMGDPIPEVAGLIKRIQETHLDQLALAYMQNGQPSTSKEEFAKNKKPVLVICGDKDEDNGAAQDLSTIIPHAVFKSTPGDHNNASKTPEFSKEVIAFLKTK